MKVKTVLEGLGGSDVVETAYVTIDFPVTLPDNDHLFTDENEMAAIGMCPDDWIAIGWEARMAWREKAYAARAVMR